MSESKSPASGETVAKNSLSYRDAGVDIDAGNALVEAIKPHAKSTERSGVMAGLGGFGGFFDLKAAGYSDPVLVAANDGVGTKLKIAIETGRHDDVGIDLVAMCVNDLVVQGAEPLFFLDYFATGALDVEEATRVIAGIAEGCKQAGCALIGGETAEMPGMYASGDYDLAGFSVGAVERGQELGSGLVSEGDIILGLGSNGVHSNGFSLVRKVMEIAQLSYSDPAPFESDTTPVTMGEVLLRPTKIYVKSCLHALRAGGIHGLAHITGGGLLENIPRVLPKGLGADLKAGSWSVPPVFNWLSKAGGIPAREMVRTFNCGIGMVVIVDKTRVNDLMDIFNSHGEISQIGEIVSREAISDTLDLPESIVQIDGLDSSWLS